MKAKQKYLVTEEKYFVNPHGSADLGGVEKSIKSGKDFDEFYSEWVKNKEKYLVCDYYFCDYYWRDEDDLEGSEDGYNSMASKLKMKKITDEEAEKYALIIKTYNKLE